LGSLLSTARGSAVTYFDSLNQCTVEQAGYPAALRALLPEYTWSNVLSRVQEDNATCGLWVAWAAETWSQACREESRGDLRCRLRTRCVEVRQTGGIPLITNFRERLRRDHPALGCLTHTVTSLTPVDDGTGTPQNPTTISDSDDDRTTTRPSRRAPFPGPIERPPGGRKAVVDTTPLPPPPRASSPGRRMELIKSAGGMSP
jgi:hypothetical protein